ncbi:hypothetical protein SKAU_G00377490 [Synaphobranchus kaupii]|uniref:C1q domain-containing protein n=1 Tax=Synaphobranchus kaupii TaxID=118154 RepID=A0A9Q1ECZ4_SYNKA|nr:hypothetical protein SKAU_G00377490 [Synaphobranchus kaupii]
MSELQLGDRVLSLGADGRLTFSEVILWLDRRPAARERYVLLSTEGSPEPLSLSADHVTFIAPSNATAASPVTMVPVFAKDLRRGHLLYRHCPGGGSLTASRVTDVQESEELGAYAPMTVEGNLIVDGHLASCYALQCRQYLAHLPFAPYRLLHFLRSYVPLFTHLSPLQREQEGQGVHWYASAWLQVGQWFRMVGAMLSVLLWLLGGSVAEKSPAVSAPCQPDIYTQLRELRSQVEAIKIECGDAPVVAFSVSLLDAGRGHSGPFNIDTVLVFRNVITNRGNAYSPSTGVFTTPVDGLYYFSFTGHSAGPHASAVSLFRNAERVATAYDRASPGTVHSVGNGAALWLKAGDRVTLRLWARTLVYGDAALCQTTFSGFLVSLT